MAYIIDLVTFAAFVFFFYYRIIRYLHIFQQNEYNTSRFVSWLITSMAFDKRISVTLILIGISTSFVQNSGLVQLFFEKGMVALLFGVAALMEPNPLKVAKKKLVLTNRVKRILAISLTFAAITSAFTVTISGAISWLVAVQLIPMIMVLSKFFLDPVETHIHNSFQNSAENRMREVAPCTIGITGSFGKTSVKHILGHILQMNTNAQFTPGSVNTVMGISRFINEQLNDNCRYFLAEMGAYGTGSISNLCRFVPPNYGIITSVGEAHYERFKNLETVAKAKFELAQAVFHLNGKVVVDESVLKHIYACQYVEQNRAIFIVVGVKHTADIKILSIDQTVRGLNIKIHYDKNEHIIFAPLYGLHHGRNIVLAYALALSLGFPSKRIIQTIRTIPQVSHRLEVKKHHSGATYIDDAYNTNPVGFLNGLDLLQTLGNACGRRILITPGVVELGEKHKEVHLELGKKAAIATDITIVLCPKRVATFVEGFMSISGHGTLITFNNFSDAENWIGQNLEFNDTILIANDLPDMIERRFIC
ncbi:MAG TPA: UDP-N-acetylmuramoyl-tripeptide--D-alanyl-D-alanine ligase [Hyphomicrobiaceae bacterium MAG_BT-2024]